MTKEHVLLAFAGALIVLGLMVIVAAVRRARRREFARERVDALLTLVAESEMTEVAEAPAPFITPEPDIEDDELWNVPVPVREPPVFRPRPPQAALAHPYVITLSDSSGSFGVRPGSDLASTRVRLSFDRGQT